MESHLGKFQLKIEWTFQISPAQRQLCLETNHGIFHVPFVQFALRPIWVWSGWELKTLYAYHLTPSPSTISTHTHTHAHSNSLKVPIVCHTNESNARTIPINFERFLMFMLLLTLCFCAIHLPLNHSSCLRSHISYRLNTKFVLLFLYIKRLNWKPMHPRAHTEADLLIWCANKTCNTIEFYQRQFPQQ